MSPAEASARAAIRHLLARYTSHGDRGAIDQMVTVFAPDATLIVPDGRFEGRDAIRAFLQDIATRGVLTGARPVPARHHLSTSLIELDTPDAAHGWTSFLLVREGVILQSGIYVDRYGSSQGDWTIRERRVKMEFDAIPPA